MPAIPVYAKVEFHVSDQELMLLKESVDLMAEALSELSSDLTSAGRSASVALGAWRTVHQAIETTIQERAGQPCPNR